MVPQSCAHQETINIQWIAFFLAPCDHLSVLYMSFSSSCCLQHDVHDRQLLSELMFLRLAVSGATEPEESCINPVQFIGASRAGRGRIYSAAEFLVASRSNKQLKWTSHSEKQIITLESVKIVIQKDWIVRKLHITTVRAMEKNEFSLKNEC